jgi:hypothetical protein
MGIEIAADRLIVAAKLQEIGIWGLYVGVALQKIAQTMLNPATASHIAGLPGWLDVALGVTIVAAWGAVTLALIRRLGRAARAQRALVNAPRPVPGRDALR